MPATPDQEEEGPVGHQVPSPIGVSETQVGLAKVVVVVVDVVVVVAFVVVVVVVVTGGGAAAGSGNGGGGGGGCRYQQCQQKVLCSLHLERGAFNVVYHKFMIIFLDRLTRVGAKSACSGDHERVTA